MLNRSTELIFLVVPSWFGIVVYSPSNPSICGCVYKLEILVLQNGCFNGKMITKRGILAGDTIWINGFTPHSSWPNSGNKFCLVQSRHKQAEHKRPGVTDAGGSGWSPAS